ncbi:DUF3800 domain-containing protein [Rufibacter sp. LB8]|uniref:DUF3800 domain-containing protein n=1 Tax=Rufibacter sp. LB8 TaxID=2777781 RepID=UPI00178C6F5F|nr:DUF3800 domain-containing protein [Rufibacter sp. LB8]
MKKAKIYIDEFGNTHLDLSKGGTFSHFVYTSVIISEDNEEKARLLRTEVCKKFKLGPDIKSNNLGDKKYFYKRLDILKYLVENLDFTIDVLVIDKKHIDREDGGLRFKKVFYKYFQKIFITKYNQLYDSYDIIPDKVGEEFASELELFVRNQAVFLDLFNQDRTYKISDDIKGEKLIQLADIISGSIGKIYCTSHASERMEDIFNIIHSRLSVQHFPYKSNYEIKTSEKDREKDVLIRRLSQDIIEKYVKSTEGKTESLGLNLVEYLAIQNRMDPRRLVPSYEILTYLRHFNPNLTDDKLRSTIRDLRYKGLFIISHKGQPGYKLASSYDDIIEHFNHFMRYVLPMLEKLKAINEKMTNSSFNELNPLEKDARFQLVKNLIGQIKSN